MEIHHSIVDRCSPQNTLIVLGDFNAINGTERDGYKLCVGPHGSGIRNINHSLLNCAKSRKLRITNSWLQKHKPCCWTWYSNAGSVVKEIEHIHINTRWRILQRVIWSAEFFVTDQRLVAKLRIHIRSKKISRCNPTRFHLRNWGTRHVLRSMQWQSFLNWLEMLGTLEDPEETFNCETLKAAEKCIREHPRSRSDMLSQGWLGTRSNTRLSHDGLEPF